MMHFVTTKQERLHCKNAKVDETQLTAACNWKLLLIFIQVWLGKNAI